MVQHHWSKGRHHRTGKGEIHREDPGGYGCLEGETNRRNRVTGTTHRDDEATGVRIPGSIDYARISPELSLSSPLVRADGLRVVA